MTSELPLLRRVGSNHSTASISSASSKYSLPRVASEELIVPGPESVDSVYYGVDAFSPTLVDLYTPGHKRIVWSSRAHRKMMTTLHRAWHGQAWRLYSISFWSGICALASFSLLAMGFLAEAVVHEQNPARSVHRLVDDPLLAGSILFFASHALSYLEVINSCHNLELWLDEYFHGRQPVLERRFVGCFPSRIDFWTELLGMVGASFFVASRLFLSLRADGENYGVIDVERSDASLIIGYWFPFFLGSFLLLVGAYLAHVEVVHQWFSWRFVTLETWVTGLNLLSCVGIFLSSTLQFMDPFAAIFTFTACMAPFGVGCAFGMVSTVLGLVELTTIHTRNRHPEYGLLDDEEETGYGTWK